MLARLHNITCVKISHFLLKPSYNILKIIFPPPWKNDIDVDSKLSNPLFQILGMPNPILYNILWKASVNMASHSDLT